MNNQTSPLFSNTRVVDGDTFTYNIIGELHSFNRKPAVERKDGVKIWYHMGLIHNDGDEPAIIHPNGTREYWKMGKLHREGKPAIESPLLKEGLWYENGIRIYPL